MVVQINVAHRLSTGENAIHADLIRLKHYSRSSINSMQSVVQRGNLRCTRSGVPLKLYSFSHDLPHSLASCLRYLPMGIAFEKPFLNGPMYLDQNGRKHLTDQKMLDTYRSADWHRFELSHLWYYSSIA